MAVIKYKDPTTGQLTPIVGPPGKSAYDSAVEGGYTGAKEEFYKLLAAIGSVSNPNLLINGDLTNPVNQRGQVEYTATEASYAIDRWLIYLGTATVTDDGLRITNSASGQLFQIIELQAKKLVGKSMTLAVDIDGKIVSGTLAVPASGYAPGILFSGGYVTLGVRPNGFLNFAIVFTSAGTRTIAKAKLELGDRFTGFYPTDPATELAKCQRYLYVIPGAKYLYPSIALGTSYQAGGISFVVPVPTTMRTCPAATISGNWFVRGNGKTVEFNATQVSYSASYLSANAVSLAITNIAGLGSEDVGHAFELGRNNSIDANIIFDAEIY